MKTGVTEYHTHWLAEFLCGLIGGTMGLYSAIGWVVVAWGWLTQGEMTLVCSVFGVFFGIKMATGICEK